MTADTIPQFRDPTPEEDAALQAFATDFDKARARKLGFKCWREELVMHYWYNARIWRSGSPDEVNYGSVLHGIRNHFGPTWLFDVYRLPSER